jgi:hypothetical protein
VTEFRHIIRGLVRTPLFAITAIVSLALGIGANTAMFSMIDRVLLRTLPVKDPHELAFLYHPGPTQGSTSTEEPGDPSFSYPMFREMQQQQTAFLGLAGSRGGTVNLSYKNNAQPGTAHLVSGNYFRVLGVTAAIGRVFDENDDQTISGHPVVVLSYGYWSSRFGEDGSVLNETLVVNGHPMTIIGVAQKGFTTEMPGTARRLRADHDEARDHAGLGRADGSSGLLGHAGRAAQARVDVRAGGHCHQRHVSRSAGTGCRTAQGVQRGFHPPVPRQEDRAPRG